MYIYLYIDEFRRLFAENIIFTPVLYNSTIIARQHTHVALYIRRARARACGQYYVLIEIQGIKESCNINIQPKKISTVLL